jgi:hypothetical protein
MKPLISLILQMVGGFTATFLVCIAFMAVVFGIDPDVSRKGMGMNRVEYQEWIHGTVIPRMVWISVAGGILCAALGMLRSLLLKGKK